MFYKTKVIILNGSFVEIGKALVDLQAFEKNFVFDNGIEIDVSKRVFMDLSDKITLENYLVINDLLYKIMHIKSWDDYLEVWLYECKG